MPPIVADDEETVEQAERNRGNGEEVHRSDGFSKIAQKGEPTFGWFGISRRSSHPAGDRSLRDIKTKHQKLAVNAWCTPGRVLDHRMENEIPYLFGNPPPAHHSPSPGDHTPIERESRSVPSHDGLWTHDNQSLFPSGPEPSRKNPEEFIERS